MANWEWVTRIHRSIYRWSGGRVGARLWGLDMLLLTTTGRRSGQPRTLPLACFRHGPDLVVVASNNGQDHHPAWWLNLRERPEAEVQLGTRSWRVRGELAGPGERATLWPWLLQQNPMYATYEKRTTREIPVVLLRPIDPSRAGPGATPQRS